MCYIVYIYNIKNLKTEKYIFDGINLIILDQSMDIIYFIVRQIKRIGMTLSTLCIIVWM